MLSAERYITLLNRYAGKPPNVHTEVEVTLNELTELFYCTERNVKNIIRKLQDEQWIEWKPGRGRGNRSKIAFLLNRELFLLEYAKQLAQKGEYQSAFEFLHRLEDDGVREAFIQWLNSQFGLERIRHTEEERDIFVLPVYRTPVSLDPSDLSFGFDSHLLRQLFDRLLVYDFEHDRVVPSIAQHWESNDSATQWTFYLRKGIRFHHGKRLYAEDVVFTLERLKLGSNRWLVQTVEKVEALNSWTVQVTLKQPNWLFLRLMCSSYASILPCDLEGEAWTQEQGGFWSRPSGTGPFKIEHWNEGCLELSTNEEYFLGRPYLDGVKLIFMPDNIPNHSQLQWEHFVAHDSRNPAKSGHEWEQIETLSRGSSLITWNRNKPGPQQSLAFRQAISLIIDRAALITATHKQGYPASSFLPREGTSLGVQGLDPEAARKLLEQSGYDGSPLVLATGADKAESAEWLKRRCADFGIPIELLYLEKNVSMCTGLALDADAMLIQLVFADDQICELEIFLQENSIIYQHLDPVQRKWIFMLVDDILASPSKEARRALFDQIEYRLHVEHQLLFLAHQKINTYVHPSVRGVVINNLGWMDFKDIWLIGERGRIRA